MSLSFYNTLTKQKELFTSQNPPEVLLYSCGPTVYQKQHIGNLRAYIFVDTLKRALKNQDFEIKHVMNITDVGHLVSDGDTGEDKMEKSVKEQGRSAEEIADEYTTLFLEDLALLNVPMDASSVTIVKATNCIQDQIKLIEKLEEKGFTYTTKDGVYFDTSKYPEYGKLGNIDIAGLEEGARVGKNTEKRNPTDFALWKLSPHGVERAQEWDSPWGVGFPGWHIECSTMAINNLGETIDIHTGGIEHIPVHHNNEIAQSESATEKEFARVWLHNNHLQIDGEKLSKSLGNGVFLSDITEKGFHPLSYRYWLLTSHYRSQINFTWDALEASNGAYMKLLHRFHKATENGSNESFRSGFAAAVNNDLNTAEAIALVWQNELSKEDFVFADSFLGLDIKKQSDTLFDIPEEITAILEKRNEARAAKDFETADRLRTEIEQEGYVVNDTDDGSIVMRK